MNKKLFFLIFALLLFQISENTKHHSHPQKTLETSQEHEFIPFKNAKKARISQKEKFKIKDFISSLNTFAGSIDQFFGGVFDHLILRKQSTVKKQSVVYRENFASQNGGAQILMVSSSKIKSPRAILKNDPDAYLFTADELPITIVIGLKEEILIDSFVVQSGEAYSCIVQDFMIEGAFSLQKEEWILLGNFTAQDSFEAQEFAVQQRIIRYLRLTILSSFGKWKYFTLSQIGVYGEGLFSHAMESLLQADYNNEKNKTSEQNQSIPVNLQTKKHKNKFSNKQIHAKEILVEAFTEVAGQQNQKTNIPTIKNIQEQTYNSQELKLNDSQINEKPTSKQKKSISNLKKKINYLEKRNYELHQEIKEIKKITVQKIAQLEIKYHEKDTHKHHITHHQSNWHSLSFNSHLAALFSIIINVICIVLVCFVFKHKLVQKRNKTSQSVITESSQEKMKNDKNNDKQQKNRKIKSN